MQAESELGSDASDARIMTVRRDLQAALPCLKTVGQQCESAQKAQSQGRRLGNHINLHHAKGVERFLAVLEPQIDRKSPRRSSDLISPSANSANPPKRPKVKAEGSGTTSICTTRKASNDSSPFSNPR